MTKDNGRKHCQLLFTCLPASPPSIAWPCPSCHRFYLPRFSVPVRGAEASNGRGDGAGRGRGGGNEGRGMVEWRRRGRGGGLTCTASQQSTKCLIRGSDWTTANAATLAKHILLFDQLEYTDDRQTCPCADPGTRG